MNEEQIKLIASMTRDEMKKQIKQNAEDTAKLIAEHRKNIEALYDDTKKTIEGFGEAYKKLEEKLIRADLEIEYLKKYKPKDGEKGEKGDKGDKGDDGITPTHKGLYDPSIKYSQGDIVMKNNASWYKTDHPDNSLPSDGWKLLAKAIQGKKGDRGDIPKNVLDDINDRLAMVEEGIK